MRHPFFIAKTELLLCFAAIIGAACVPSEELQLPHTPVRAPENARWYDMNRNGRSDFALLGDGEWFTEVGYDDNEDGVIERRYPIYQQPAGPGAASVPHVVLLVDSLPWEELARRYQRGGLPMFYPPEKVMPPFPTATDLTFGRLLGAPTPSGLVSVYYDRSAARMVDLYAAQKRGQRRDWERLLDYEASSEEIARSSLQPEVWLRDEFLRIRKQVQGAQNGLLLMYPMSAGFAITRRGPLGAELVMDELERLCVQLLYDRQGAIQISLIGNHGTALQPAARIDLSTTLRATGFQPTKTLKGPRDVVLEDDGLLQVQTLHTQKPAEVAAALLTRDEVALAFYVENGRVVVRDSEGQATIEQREGRFRYVPDGHDPLYYVPVAEALAAAGRLNRAGLGDDRLWFRATLAHRYPDALRRIFGAFFGGAISTPDLIVTLHEGFSVGTAPDAELARMAWVHGGLDQHTSIGFAMSTENRLRTPLRTEEVLPALIPDVATLLRERKSRR